MGSQRIAAIGADGVASPGRRAAPTAVTTAASFPQLLGRAGDDGATASGSAALALAALVARHAPRLGRYEKRIMTLMINGRLDFAFAAGRTIAIAADSVRGSDVGVIPLAS